MAKIVQALTRASKEYDQKTFQSLVRDLDAVINKLNTTFQEELKQEVERLKALLNGEDVIKNSLSSFIPSFTK